MAPPEQSDSSDASLPRFTAQYTSKDLILYAIALGFGSGDENRDNDELRYLFERHEKFQAVPSFPLVLPFWADYSNGTSFDLKPFPPPMIKAVGVLPQKFLRRQDTSIENLPVIHSSQSITWHKPVPTQRTTGDSTIQTTLSSRILSVAPKKAGTFVTSETKIRSSDSELLCTMQGTNLILGMPPDDVIAYGTTTRKRQRNSLVMNRSPVFEWTYKTLSNQALLYRLASGDTNSIHVDASDLPIVGASKRPLLHGLCTMGIAVRGILKFLNETGCSECQFVRLEADFTKPVLVGDGLCLRIWNNGTTQNGRTLSFQVCNYDTNEIVIDHGVVEVNEGAQIQSRL